jgi:hypothetical protein
MRDLVRANRICEPLLTGGDLLDQLPWVTALAGRELGVVAHVPVAASTASQEEAPVPDVLQVRLARADVREKCVGNPLPVEGRAARAECDERVLRLDAEPQPPAARHPGSTRRRPGDGV